jgi:hypothetical protein
MKFSSFTDRVPDRERRAACGTNATAMAIVTEGIDLPKATIIITANSKDGKPNKVSTTLWDTRSSQPPRYAEAIPIKVPKSAPANTEVIAMNSEEREP